MLYQRLKNLSPSNLTEAKLVVEKNKRRFPKLPLALPNSITLPHVIHVLVRENEPFAFQYARQSLHVRNTPVFQDRPTIRIWDDCMLGIRDAGLYSWVLVTLAVIGLDHGPWSTARWWAWLKASAQEYTSICFLRLPHLL